MTKLARIPGRIDSSIMEIFHGIYMKELWKTTTNLSQVTNIAAEIQTKDIYSVTATLCAKYSSWI
jgi:hypothetical protein